MHSPPFRQGLSTKHLLVRFERFIEELLDRFEQLLLLSRFYLARSKVTMLRVIPLSAQLGMTRHGVRT